MKKLVALFLFLIPITLNAQIIKPIGSVELTYNPNTTHRVINNEKAFSTQNTMSVKLHGGFYITQYFLFEGGSDILFGMGLEEDPHPYPFWNSYWFSTELVFDWLSIGYRHRSSHPVMSRKKPEHLYSESHDEIFLKLELKP